MTKRDIQADDEWIKANAAELKRELLVKAERGEPRPPPGTILARALRLFTMEAEAYRRNEQ